MSIVAAFAVPHPPVIVPAVGQGREHEVQATVDAYREVAQRVAALAPDAIVITSPHATSYLDWFHISPGAGARGDFARFGAPDDAYEIAYDREFVQTLADRCHADGIPAGTEGEQDPSLDHGTLVPVHFLREAYREAERDLPPFVRIGLSGMTPLDHYRLGQEIASVADRLGRRVVFIASGDLSHKMTADGPYGFAAEGPKFDERICQIFREGDFLGLMTFDPGFCDRAAECGLRSFQIMAGALDRTAVSCELLSHEGTLGVGYGIAAFIPEGGAGADPDRAFGERYQAWVREQAASRKRSEDLYVRLARRALESYVHSGKAVKPSRALLEQLAAGRRSDAVKEGRAVSAPVTDPPVPGTTCALRVQDALDIDDLFRLRAGAFVSLKKNGQLRGCIGTISPACDNLAEEICANAVSAGTRDPRFPAVGEEELPDLVYDVDVLGKPEEIPDATRLDPSRYGVIVSTPDGRRGLLLPDLDGVDTADKQLAIAARKGDINLGSDDVQLERFEVVRHL